MLARRYLHRPGNGGIDFTVLGFGAAPLGNLFRAIPEPQAAALLQHAWDAGLRYFDTAPLYGYGLSETRLNHFLRDKPRGDYVISTKVGRLLRASTADRRDGRGKWFDVPSRNEIYDYSHDGVMRSLEFSLERLGLDHVDILFAHDLDIFNHQTQEVLDGHLSAFMAGGYKALLALRDQGVIKAFGAGVNEWQPCRWLLDHGDFDLFLLAGRYTLLEQASLAGFMDPALARGVGVVIGGPYNSGVLATGPRPGAQYNYDAAPEPVLERVAALQAFCAAHGVRLLDAALQFPLRHRAVVSVIPGGQSTTEMNANLAAATATIPESFWSDLRERGLIDPACP